jgi:hypothetical protein
VRIWPILPISSTLPDFSSESGISLKPCYLPLPSQIATLDPPFHASDLFFGSPCCPPSWPAFWLSIEVKDFFYLQDLSSKDKLIWDRNISKSILKRIRKTDRHQQQLSS